MRRIAVSVTLVGLMAVSPLPAVSLPPAPVSNVASILYQWVPGDVREPEVPLEVVGGGTLVYSNLDPVDWHTITAYDLDENGDPLFESDLLGQGQSEIIDGVEDLPLGDYRFHCRIHSGMDGVLRVVP